MANVKLDVVGHVMAVVVKPWLWRPSALNCGRAFPQESAMNGSRGRWAPKAAADAAPPPDQGFPETNLPCDACSGRGWTICSFCSGQKTNVQVRKSRFYRRCPSCKAVGAVLCSRCKVFRCVSFPDERDRKPNVSAKS